MNKRKTFSPEVISSQDRELAVELPDAGSHIVVAGSGVFGSWTALYLRRKGYLVTLVDPWGPGNNRSSSGGESRLMRKLYGPNDYYFKMAEESIPLWRELENQTGTAIYEETGVYWFLKERHDPLLYDQEHFHSFLEDDLEILTETEAESIFPKVNFHDVAEIIVERTAGFLRARLGVQAVHDLLIKEGGMSQRAFLIPGNVNHKTLQSCVSKGGEQLAADFFIFACGPWNKRIFPELFKDGLQVTRQEVLYFGYPEDYTSQLPCWVDLDIDNLFYGIPNGDNRGFKIALDERGPEIDPTSENRGSTEQIIQRSRSYLAKRFPFLRNAPLLESRVCQYSNTGNGDFFIEAHPEFNNVCIIGGGNGHGYKHGPAFGKLCAEIIAGDSVVPGIFAGL